MKRHKLAVAATIILLCGGVAYLFGQRSLHSVRLAFADEQTEIFIDMADKAAKSLRQSPPDVRAAVGYLKYAHSYYPSGTKQLAGSRLDTIVERCRTLAEWRIIQMLRSATGRDLGDDPEVWIQQFPE